MHGSEGENINDNQTTIFSSHNVDRSHGADSDIMDMIVPHVYSTLTTSHTLGSHSQSTSTLLSFLKFSSFGKYKC